MYTVLEEPFKYIDDRSITYCDINHLIAQVTSAVSSNSRHYSECQLTLEQLTTNLIPFKELNLVNLFFFTFTIIGEM